MGNGKRPLKIFARQGLLKMLRGRILKAANVFSGEFMLSEPED
jgi:hypothetical protein